MLNSGETIIIPSLIQYVSANPVRIWRMHMMSIPVMSK